MTVLWVLEKPKQAKIAISQSLLGEFAVRCFASLQNFSLLAKRSRSQPDGLLIDRRDFDESQSQQLRLIASSLLKESRMIDVVKEIKLSRAAANFRLNISVETILHTPHSIYSLLEISKQKEDTGSAKKSLSIGEYVFDSELLTLVDACQQLRSEFSPKEGRILKLLLETQSDCLSRAEIESKIWHSQRVSKRTVDSHISRLRKKLLPLGIAIESRYGQGYSLELEADF